MKPPVASTVATGMIPEYDPNRREFELQHMDELRLGDAVAVHFDVMRLEPADAEYA